MLKLASSNGEEVTDSATVVPLKAKPENEKELSTDEEYKERQRKAAALRVENNKRTSRIYKLTKK